MNVTSQRPASWQCQRFSAKAVRAAVALFVLLTCLRVWTGAQPLVQPARAQIPDSGRQRKLLLGEARRTNQLLAEIAQILRERTLNVRLAPADNREGAPALRPVRP